MIAPLTRSFFLLLLLLAPACGDSEDNGGLASELELDGDAAAAEVWVPEGHDWIGDWTSLTQEVQEALAGTAGKAMTDLRFIVSDRERVRDVLERNIARRLPADAELPFASKQLDAVAGGLVGIFDLEKKVVHISLDTFGSMAELLGSPGLQSREAAFAVMVHEGCHAIIDQRHDLSDLFRTAQANGEEAVQAADAVSEGFAQYLARSTCARAGRSEGFEAFTRAITQLPEDLDAGQRLLAEQTVRVFGFAYAHGETFVTAVMDELGASGETRLFDRPPLTRVEVLRPEWYLDPESKPAHAFAVGDALGLVPPAFDWVEDISFVRRELASTDIAEGNAGALGPARAAEMGGLIELCEAHIGLTPGGNSMALVGLTIFPDEAAADRFLAFAREASDLKDAQLQEGSTVRVVASETTTVDEELGIGVRQVKTVETFGQKVPVSSLMVRRGRLMVEITLSNLEMTVEDVDALAVSLFRTANYED